MNKNITKSILALMACSAAFCACSREEADLFDKSAADRLSEVSEVYTHRLADKGGEWILEYFPTNYSDSITSAYAARSKGYLLLNKFNADGSVLVAMKNEQSRNKYRESVSAWEVITDLGPVLTYNTYNECIHQFSDPQNESGLSGTGIGGDYEFVITHLEADATQTMLKGKKRGSYSRLTRMAEGTNFEEYYAALEEFAENHFPENMPNDLVMEIGGKNYYARSLSTGIACIWPVGTSWADNKTYHPFLLSKLGDEFHLRFRDAYEPVEGTSVQEYVWDATNYRFVDVADSKNIIRGLDASDIAAHYVHCVSLNGWRLDVNALEGDAAAIVNPVIDAIDAKYKKDRTTGFQEITVKLFQDDSDPDNLKEYMQVDVYYKQGAMNRHLVYNYVFGVQDGKVVATYDSAKDKLSRDNQQMVQPVIDMFAGSFSATAPAESGFLINKVVLTSASGLSFTMNYIQKSAF